MDHDNGLLRRKWDACEWTFEWTSNLSILICLQLERLPNFHTLARSTTAMLSNCLSSLLILSPSLIFFLPRCLTRAETTSSGPFPAFQPGPPQFTAGILCVRQKSKMRLPFLRSPSPTRCLLVTASQPLLPTNRDPPSPLPFPSRRFPIPQDCHLPL